MSDYLFAISIKNIEVAVDIAGKQRMYTQRMLKDYVMVGMNNNYSNPKKDLMETVNNFEEHLTALYNFTKDNDTKKIIEATQKLWKDIKPILNSKPSKEKVKELQKNLDLLLKQSDKTTKLFAKQTGKQLGEIINISGRQRMLSQRMASLYMLKVWKIDDLNFKQKMQTSMNLFKSSLEKLQSYDNNTQEIKQLLNKTKRSFMFFEFMNRSKSKFIPSLIYKKSNEILKNMNTATKLYTQIKN